MLPIGGGPPGVGGGVGVGDGVGGRVGGTGTGGVGVGSSVGLRVGLFLLFFEVLLLEEEDMPFLPSGRRPRSAFAGSPSTKLEDEMTKVPTRRKITFLEKIIFRSFFLF